MGREVPLYQNMIDDLIHQIESGTVHSGQKLPSEAALGHQYHVSRITVRRALAELANRHYIVKRHGIGSFVAERSRTQPRLAGLPDISAMIRRTGADPRVVLTDYALLVAGGQPVVRAKLNLTRDDYLYQFRYEIYSDNDMIGTADWFGDYRRFPHLYLSELEHQGLLSLLRSKYQFTPQFQTVRTSRLATARERRELLGGTGNSAVHLHVSGVEHQRLLLYGEISLMGPVVMYLFN